jgi:hypothetical protein
MLSKNLANLCELWGISPDDWRVRAEAYWFSCQSLLAISNWNCRTTAVSSS